MKRDELRSCLASSIARLYDTVTIRSLAAVWHGELRVLLYLYQHSDAEMNPSVLSDALQVSRARITTALSSLRKKKCIIMELCEDDRRRMRVLLTPDGKRLIELRRAEINQQFDQLISGMGDANVVELLRLMDLFVRVVQENERRTDNS